MVYLAKGGFWIGIGQVVSSLSTFGLAVAFANLLPPEVYGTYKYALGLAGMFAVFTLPGNATALSRAVARGNDGNLRTATRERILWSIAGLFVALALALYYFLAGNYLLASASVIIACTLPIFDTFTLYAAFLTGKKDFKTQTLYHAITQGVSVAVLITTTFFTDNLIILLLAYFLPLAAIRYLFYRTTVGRIADDARIDPAMSTYGKHLSAMNVLNSIASNIDKLLLWHFLGPIQLAVYAFAIAIPEQMKGPLKGMGELVLPKFSGKSPEEVARALPGFWKKMWMYTGALCVVSLSYVLIAPIIFSVFFPLYMDSVLYSQLFALSIPAAASIVPLAVLSAQKKTGAQYFLNIAQPLIQTLLFFLLIPPWGIMGAIVAWIAGRYAATLLTVITTVRALRT